MQSHGFGTSGQNDAMDNPKHSWAPESVVVAAGRPDAPGRPLNAPIVPVSTYQHGGDAGYARDDGTESWASFEAVIGALEGGAAVAFASGMAASAAVFGLLDVGATVVLGDDCYHGVRQLAERGRTASGWDVVILPVTDTSAWSEAATSADLLWVETPSNPMLHIADLAAIGKARRRPNAMLVVDSTFATPLNQRPLAVGADIVVHSATKLLGGHSDLMGGVAVASSGALREALATQRRVAGATPGALETFLALRGTRTLAIRLERAQANASELAHRLVRHRAVAAVHYPGLASHPQHALAAKQMAGPGSVVSFELRGGNAAADAACAAVELISHATSLGSVESTMERRTGLGGQHHLPAGLVRLSVGIEDIEDLWHDLDEALGGGD